jgi:NAD(P)-dependent dehydrogenase (short-subunit alcohol dehydrogenase family)
MSGRFDGRVVVVTGGARGLGEAIVRRFVVEGGRVVVADVGDPAEPLDGVRYLHCDVTDRERVEGAARSVEEVEGRLDVLVNCAGIQRVGLTDEIDPDEWRRVVEVHLFGAYHWGREALRIMRTQRAGAIVTVASVAGIFALPGRGPYSSAKAGLMGLTRVMAVEVASLGIRVNAVAPGMARTAMLDQGIADGSIDADGMMEEIPMRRFGTTDEMANVVLFLASEDAGYVTGQTVVVDGGWTILGMRSRPEWLSAD